MHTHLDDVVVAEVRDAEHNRNETVNDLEHGGAGAKRHERRYGAGRRQQQVLPEDNPVGSPATKRD